MTQATITRPRHLTMRAWRWERRKTSLLPVAATAALFGLLGALSGCWNYQYNQEIYAEQQMTWEAVLINGVQLPAMVFLPAGLAMFAAVDAARAQKARSWQRARSLDRAGVLLRAQVLRNLERAVVTALVFSSMIIGAIMVMGFGQDLLADGGLAVIVGRTLASVPCYWAVGSVITAAGLWIRGFSGLAAAGLLGSILAMAIRVAAPGLSWLMPFALPVNAMVAKGGDELFSFSDMAGWAGIGLAWVIALYGVARRRAARMEA